ncbi:MAG: hypothetical protein AAGJ79_12590 [Verrucomicrobiota bacterium]
MKSFPLLATLFSVFVVFHTPVMLSAQEETKPAPEAAKAEKKKAAPAKKPAEKNQNANKAKGGSGKGKGSGKAAGKGNKQAVPKAAGQKKPEAKAAPAPKNEAAAKPAPPKKAAAPGKKDTVQPPSKAAPKPPAGNDPVKSKTSEKKTSKKQEPAKPAPVKKSPPKTTPAAKKPPVQKPAPTAATGPLTAHLRLKSIPKFQVKKGDDSVMAIFVYDVIDVFDGSYSGRTIKVANGVVVCGHPTGAADEKPGAETTLHLVPLSNYNFGTWNMTGNIGGVVYTPKL